MSVDTVPGLRVDPAGERSARHPVATSISGFLAGLVFLVVVPAACLAGLQALASERLAERLVPGLLALVLVPAGLVLNRRTRPFGWYFTLGIVVTALVVVGVTAAVVWVMVRTSL